MYLLTLLSAMSMPSLSSSPWMQGAPQLGFSWPILRIRSSDLARKERSSGLAAPHLPPPEAAKPSYDSFWLDDAMAESQSRQRRDRQIHNRPSPEVNFGRFLGDRRSTPPWWGRGRVSSPGQH